MKKSFLLIVCLMSLNASFAQDFIKGGNYVSVGYGFNPWSVNTVKAYKSYPGYKHFGIGPIIAGYERGITDVLGIGRIGVGGSVAFSTHTSQWTETNLVATGLPFPQPQYVYQTFDVKYSWTEIALMAKAAYHFEFDVPKMDVYAGVGVGYNIYIDKYTHGNPAYNSSNLISRPSAVAHREFVGIRYYFSDAFGVYAEAGYGTSVISGGAIFAF